MTRKSLSETEETFQLTDLQRIVRGFEDRTLPKAEWTHNAHLIISVWYCSLHDAQTAFKYIKEGVIAYNVAVGTPNTDSGGYHETITKFWVWQTKQFLEQYNDDFTSNCRAFLQHKMANKDAPFQFFSRELLFSVEARKNWVLPDIISIDIK